MTRRKSQAAIFHDMNRLIEQNIFFDLNSINYSYGYVRIGLSTPQGSWHGMGNNGIVNDKIPMPCLDEDNEDIPYLRKVFEFIEANDDKFDASRIYAEGGSQNSVFSAYLAFCFRFKSSTYLLLTKMLSANCLIFPSFFGSCFRREFFP